MHHADAMAVPARTPEGGAWGRVTVLGVGAFAVGTDMFVVPGLLAPIGHDLGVTVGTAGLMVTVFGLSYAIGAPVLGAVLSARPTRELLVGAMVVLGLGAGAAALAPTFPVLLAAQVVSALAVSVSVPLSGAAAVAAVSPRHRGRALGVLLGGTSVAMVLGAPVGVLLAAVISWRAAFALVVLFAAVTALGVWRGVPAPATATCSTLHGRLRPLRSRAVVGGLAVTVLVMTASYSVSTYIGPVLGAGTTAAGTPGTGPPGTGPPGTGPPGTGPPGTGPTGSGPAGLGLFLATFGAAGTAGTWCGGMAADRGGSGRVVRLAVTALAAGFAALPLVATTVAGALAVAVVWGIAVWAFVPAQQHQLIGLGSGPVPDQPVLVLALNSSATQVGFAAGALLGGLVVDGAGPRSLLLLAVACCGAALALNAILSKEVRS